MQLNFDATNIPTSDLIPAGRYLAIIDDSKENIPKDGNGVGVSLKVKLIDGPYSNRVIWDNFVLSGGNAAKVGKDVSRLSSLCHAIGIIKPQESYELHNKPMIVSITVSQPKDGYEMRNWVGEYKPANANHTPHPFQPAQQAAGPSYQPPPAPQQAARPPWMK